MIIALLLPIESLENKKMAEGGKSFQMEDRAELEESLIRVYILPA